MKLRWHTPENDREPKLMVYSKNIVQEDGIFFYDDNYVVLQQWWRDNLGGGEWRNVELDNVEPKEEQ